MQTDVTHRSVEATYAFFVCSLLLAYCRPIHIVFDTAIPTFSPTLDIVEDSRALRDVHNYVYNSRWYLAATKSWLLFVAVYY